MFTLKQPCSLVKKNRKKNKYCRLLSGEKYYGRNGCAQSKKKGPKKKLILYHAIQKLFRNLH